MSAREHFLSGRLGDAIADAEGEVRQKPGDAGRRSFLAALLCFAGDLDRADRQLEAAGQQLGPREAVGISLLRHLIRAEKARREFLEKGRLPEFLAEPSEDLRLRLQASIAIREGKPAEAVSILEKAEELRPHSRGTADGAPFDDLRDLDDLMASFLEVLTANGKYYWIPFERVESAQFHPSADPMDLLWRRTLLSVRGGPDGEVYIPVLYPASHRSADDKVRLGRVTQWQGGDGSPVSGLGQRVLLAGEKDMAILDLKSIEITGPVQGGA